MVSIRYVQLKHNCNSSYTIYIETKFNFTWINVGNHFDSSSHTWLYGSIRISEDDPNVRRIKF